MLSLITLTRLSRRLDVSPQRIQRKIKARLIEPAAHNVNGSPLFDESLIEQYRASIAQEAR